MADITLSSAVRNNLLSLQNTADLLGKTQQRLATGLKVNSALDDPTAFFTASSLNSRAGDLNRLLDSVGNALQTIRAADNGISAINKLVENAQASARQALQSPASTTVAAAASQVTGGVFFQDDTAAQLTGTVTVAADSAAAAVGTAIAADTAAVSASSTGGAVAGTELLNNIDGAVLATGDSLTITSSDGSFSNVSISFTAAGGATTGATLDVTAASVTNLITEINAQAGSAVASIVGGEISITSPTGNIAFGGTNAATTLSFADAQPTNAAFSAAIAGSQTLTFTVGGNTDTITFGTNDGANQVSNRAELAARLTAISGGGGNTGATFALNGSNQITATAATAGAGDITINGGAAALTLAGFTAGQVVEPSNATAGLAAAISGNEQLTFTINGNTDTVTFGTNDGAGQVSNRAELETRLAAISGSNGNTGGTFAITSNNVTATAANVAAGAVSVAGGTNALAFAGFTANQSASATSAGLVAATGTATVQFGTAPAQNLNFANINSVSDLSTALGALTGGTGAVTSSGAIQFTGANLTDSITIGGTVTGTGLTAGTTAATAASTTPNAQRASLETEFNNLLNQIDQLAGDASFNGNNLLDGGNLTVIFNENGSSSLAISGVTFNSSGLGLSSATSGSFQNDSTINAKLTELETATSSLRAQSSTFGSNLSIVEIRQDFTKNLINTLETGAGNLTLADSNEEGANLLALQTRQQLSSVALSLASQSDQNVLRLF